MLTPDLIELPIEVFGGYNPALVPTVCPPGASLLTQDCDFPEGGVCTRGGLFAIFGPGNGIPAAATINGLKTYLTPTTAHRLMVWDSAGNLYKESPDGTLTLLFQRPQGANTLYQSSTLFGREYQAFYAYSDPLLGLDIPRQYDDTYWDRVSQVGPGVGPSSFYTPTIAISTVSRTSYVTTVTTATNHGLSKGQTVYIENVGDPTFNGTYVVISITSPTVFVYWNLSFSMSNVFLSRSSNVVTARVPQALINGTPTIFIVSPGDTSFTGQFTVASVSADGFTFTYNQSGNDGTINGATVYVLGDVINQEIMSVDVAGGIATVTYTQELGTELAIQQPTVAVGQTITVAATSDSTLNANQTITSVPSPGVILFDTMASDETLGAGGYFSPYIPDNTSTGGDVGVAGVISVGLHQCAVAFITRQGYITKPSPPVYLEVDGVHEIGINDIPTGPSNVISRLLLFTPAIISPATTGTFYSLPNGVSQIPNSIMLIPDNTTTTAIVNFSDAVLIAGLQAEYLFTQIELGECGSVNGYNARLAWCGERNKVGNFNNLTFDGGWTYIPQFGYVPNGWTPDSINYASATRGSGSGDWQDCFIIPHSNAGGNAQGVIRQSAYQDYLQVPIIAQNTSYSVRVRLAYNNSIGISSQFGIFYINLQSVIGGYTTNGMQLNLQTAIGTLPALQFMEFSSILTAPLYTIPTDLVLQVYGIGINNADIYVDSIEIYPTLQPYNFSTARFSHAYNPESYDATTDEIQIRPNDGQMLHASFPLRGNLYFGKDHYLCYVTDDGINEPSAWAVNEVSATVGICGPNAVDWNEEWAVFAERSGLYIFWGGDPVKITPEIQQDASNTGKICWNSINWAASQCIWVRIDKVNKQILVGVPVGFGVTLPNYVFMIDYKWLENAQDIASSPMVTYSAFTGKILGHGRGRRWMVWTIQAASMTFAERSDGTTQPFFGNSIGNGKLYQKIPVPYQLSDDGVPINSFYTTYFSPSHVEEQMVQLGAHRKLLGYLKWRATGFGIMSIAITTALRTTNLRGYILSPIPLGDGERGIEIAGERFSFTVGTNAVGSWFQLEQLIPCMKKHPTILVRGANV